MKKPLVLLTLLPLSACISFGAKPPPALLTLNSAAAPVVGRTQSSSGAATITVLTPTVPQSLATARVPVHATGTTVAYIVNAQWVEQPARLFARLLSDTIASTTGRVVLNSGQVVADPGARLSGDLRNFGIDAASSSAVVTYDAALVRAPGAAIEQRRFEARVPVAAIEPVAVGAGLNQAANQVAAEVAAWVGR